MTITTALRARIKAARKRGARWVRVVELARLTGSGEGRSILWVRLISRGEVHQTTVHTREERYPELFDLAAKLAPDAKRILSFGCSTGEELIAIRRRFAKAEIVGAEINARARRIAARRLAGDARIAVTHPRSIRGRFEIIFALAVLQREPHRVAEAGVQDLSRFYPFAKFDSAVVSLVDRLQPNGLFCVMHTHYRVEDSAAARQLDSLAQSPLLDGPLFAPDGRLSGASVARSIFRKR